MRCFQFTSFGRDFLSPVSGRVSSRRVGAALRAARRRFPAGTVVRGLCPYGSDGGAGWRFMAEGCCLLMWEAV